MRSVDGRADAGVDGDAVHAPLRSAQHREATAGRARPAERRHAHR
ncbi:hypothetical protein [Kineococcus esterisolvens]